jgi:thymidine kinase
LDILIVEMGWMEAICGPMFSGKSEELIRRLRRAAIARKRVQVFKPAIDTRYSETEIVTHADTRMPSEAVMSANDILSKIDGRTEVVGIDESHFFGPELIDVADRLACDGRRVIIAGLDTDFMGRPFPPMPNLLALAESITKTLAICVRCGNPAKNSQRLVGSGELILVGAAGSYEARCRRCFEPGAPKQEIMQFVAAPNNGNAPHS